MNRLAPSATQDDVQQSPSSQDDARQWRLFDGDARVLSMALGFGAVFGFLLQKGGVAKFDILVGVLLLQNFVVIKVMLSAILVGMVGFHLLEGQGLVERKIKPTHYGGNALGGLIFGAGFALLAYCPGTDAAAVGQGNLDALVGMLGMLLGSYAYAVAYQHSAGRIANTGDRGKLTIPDLVRMRPVTFVAVATPVLVACLLALERFDPG